MVYYVYTAIIIVTIDKHKLIYNNMISVFSTNYSVLLVRFQEMLKVVATIVHFYWKQNAVQLKTCKCIPKYGRGSGRLYIAACI